ncbi:hypothetical protein JR316_0011656 [Psilocybe cubensis]|uniref:Uncharacterized protein n=2 Tax=Psilocybe cubensis TaxID=181762 RepID=A0ACB8GKM4_PSICU|nr:hypothetical protein JR316_0011656 [Psilocybe cubensis]KAH9476086.1 hypothetical protein JR316_0011656 [Psilocybe cubensis]
MSTPNTDTYFTSTLRMVDETRSPIYTPPSTPTLEITSNIRPSDDVAVRDGILALMTHHDTPESKSTVRIIRSASQKLEGQESALSPIIDKNQESERAPVPCSAQNIQQQHRVAGHTAVPGDTVISAAQVGDSAEMYALRYAYENRLHAVSLDLHQTRGELEDVRMMLASSMLDYDKMVTKYHEVTQASILERQQTEALLEQAKVELTTIKEAYRQGWSMHLRNTGVEVEEARRFIAEQAKIQHGLDMRLKSETVSREQTDKNIDTMRRCMEDILAQETQRFLEERATAATVGAVIEELSTQLDHGNFGKAEEHHFEVKAQGTEPPQGAAVHSQNGYHTVFLTLRNLIFHLQELCTHMRGKGLIIDFLGSLISTLRTRNVDGAGNLADMSGVQTASVRLSDTTLYNRRETLSKAQQERNDELAQHRLTIKLPCAGLKSITKPSSISVKGDELK